MIDLLNKNNIIFNNSPLEKLNAFVQKNDFSSVFVLVDENTKEFCLNYFSKEVPFDFEAITIQSGETYKNIHTCLKVWEELSEKGADRKSLLINLGGGVVTDTGGFIASCFRRGIAFVHVPTTLLAMVDAALGGKNGVDLNNLKNQIGIINLPALVLVDENFLKTLPENEIRSGFAEMIKHGMIDIEKSSYFEECMSIKNFESSRISNLIEGSIHIKMRTVNEDMDESGSRKILNYGHTLGHAIESYRMGLDTDHHLLHGEAIAIGLVLETYISHKMYDFPLKDLNILKTFISEKYTSQDFSREEQKKIIELMKYDKKNEKDNVNFVLLEGIGSPRLNCQVEEQLIYEAFDFYQS
jgi:3-dehydroquinate synthase